MIVKQELSLRLLAAYLRRTHNPKLVELMKWVLLAWRRTKQHAQALYKLVVVVGSVKVGFLGWWVVAGTEKVDRGRAEDIHKMEIWIHPSKYRLKHHYSSTRAVNIYAFLVGFWTCGFVLLLQDVVQIVIRYKLLKWTIP